MTPEEQAAILRMMGNRTFPLPEPGQLQPHYPTVASTLLPMVEAIRKLIPPSASVQARGTNVPYWMVPQPQAAQPAPVTNAPVAPANDGGFGDAEKETLNRERIVNQLGDFSKRVLSSKALMGGE